MTAREIQIDLLRRLVDMACALTESSKTKLSDEAIRILKEEIARERMRPIDGDRVIDVEATCLIECMAELTYLRAGCDKNRESRMVMFINSLAIFMRVDLANAERSLV